MQRSYSGDNSCTFGGLKPHRSSRLGTNSWPRQRRGPHVGPLLVARRIARETASMGGRCVAGERDRGHLKELDGGARVNRAVFARVIRRFLVLHSRAGKEAFRYVLDGCVGQCGEKLMFLIATVAALIPNLNRG